MPGLAQARKARLSIPRFQRPRHPQAPRLGQRKPVYHQHAGLAQRVVAKATPSPATTPAQPSNAAAPSIPATQSTPTDPLANTSPAPKAPGGLFDLPSYSGPGEDPRDAQYWANLAKLRFGAEQKYSEGLREQQMADTGYNDALQTAIRNRSQQQRGLGESAIRSNLSSSGWLDRSEAEDTTAYTQERSHAQLQKTEEDAAREAARKAVREGYSLDAASELAEAAGRLAQRKQQEAERAEALAALQAEQGGGAEEEGGGGGPGPGSYVGLGGHIKPWKKPKVSVGQAKVAQPAVKIALGKKKKAK